MLSFIINLKRAELNQSMVKLAGFNPLATINRVINLVIKYTFIRQMPNFFLKIVIITIDLNFKFTDPIIAIIYSAPIFLLTINFIRRNFAKLNSFISTPFEDLNNFYIVADTLIYFIQFAISLKLSDSGQYPKEEVISKSGFKHF